MQGLKLDQLSLDASTRRGAGGSRTTVLLPAWTQVVYQQITEQSRGIEERNFQQQNVLNIEDNIVL